MYLILLCKIKFNLSIFRILGITNAVGAIPGWLGPLVAGTFTEKKVLITNKISSVLSNTLSFSSSLL